MCLVHDKSKLWLAAPDPTEAVPIVFAESSKGAPLFLVESSKATVLKDRKSAPGVVTKTGDCGIATSSPDELGSDDSLEQTQEAVSLSVKNRVGEDFAKVGEYGLLRPFEMKSGRLFQMAQI